ncbi:MAG: helix-turn-helix domain-containing protein [Alphaproteobacteria bacterium]|nr:helix-turn-helix domain-containing protein [Alphaproteobacteria bacterium]MDX5415949.1 helix-turn-helix domain-containing protein [Alphaproteobacteria bacterium]MDX5493246.1 helix-turn-helix domain-containing protein [Alphaproteobacteria bacterium]
MRTRIRHFRKARGLTQTELAEALGTTAATVSRLETADMTVSTDWLERLGEALGVDVRELIGGAGGSLVCQAELRRGGQVATLPAGIPLEPSIAEGSREPLAFLVAEDMGPYAAGDMLIADRVQAEDATAFGGRDCIAMGMDTARHFGRLVEIDGRRCAIVPPEAGAAAIIVEDADWIAPVVTLIRRFPPVSPRRSGR